MPLLWTNKNRLTRFCQIVSDLQSSQRSPSLVVQTGFPTSLIDLFIKNRTRFTKPKSNKPFHSQTSDPPPPETPSFVDCTESDRTESLSLTQLITDENLHVNDDGVCDSDHGVCRVRKSDDGSGSKSLLVTFFMMIVIVVSIASFEKLIVGISVSAFALMFLEYAGKRLCSKAKEEIKVVVTDSLSFDEIKVVDVCSEDNSSCDGAKGDKKFDCSNEKVVDSCKLSLHESKGSNSVKFKSKLKKLLTKKLQCSRKEGKEKRGKENQVESMNVEKDFELKEEVVESGSKSSLLLNVTQENNMTLNSGDKRLDRVGNSDYVILFVIVLVGLVLGRFPALILTITWCFMLKIVTIRGRSKVPLIKSSVPIS